MKAKLELVLAHVTINPEKAGGDEEGEKGSSLKFEGDVPLKQLDGLFADAKVFEALGRTLYGDDEKGVDLVAHDITAIEMNLRLEKVQASISGPVIGDERARFSGCRLNSVTLVPKHGRAVGVALKLYVHPADDGWNQLVEMVKKGVTLSLWGGSRVEDKTPAGADRQTGLALEGGEGAPSAPTGPVADAPPGTH